MIQTYLGIVAVVLFVIAAYLADTLARKLVAAGLAALATALLLH